MAADWAQCSFYIYEHRLTSAKITQTGLQRSMDLQVVPDDVALPIRDASGRWRVKFRSTESLLLIRPKIGALEVGAYG